MADDLPDLLEDRLRAFGATKEEVDRFREEHNQMDYYSRFLANQRGPGMDDASVNALLVLSRQKWAEDDAAEQTEEPVSSPPDEAPETAPEPARPAAPAQPASVTGDKPAPAMAVEEPVPTGTRETVINWVYRGESSAAQAARARAALVVERASDDPRSSLITRLEGIAGQ